MSFWNWFKRTDTPQATEPAVERGRGTWQNVNSFISAFKTFAGMRITEDSAMALSVYYACIRCISEDIAKLPLITYQRLARGKDRAFKHPNYASLHDSPNPSMTSMSLRETITHWALGWGNGYAEIAFDAYMRPSLYPIHPSRMSPVYGGNKVIYEVKNPDGTKTVFPQERILHIHGLGGDGLTGYSVLRYASESVGLGLAAQAFGSTFFGNGANGGTVLEYPGKMSDVAYERLRESWQERYVGVKNSNKPIILEEGAKFNRLAIPPEEAQFLETRQFNVEDICRWFRVPPHKVQHLLRAQGWSTLDASNTDYVTDTLMPWMVRWEQEIKRKLFLSDDEYYAEHLVNGMLRGDMKTRSEFYKGQFGIGAMCINDIREAENLNPVEGGDTYFVPSNMTPLELAVQGKVNSGNPQSEVRGATSN